MICQKCNHINEDGVNYCSDCGNQLANETKGQPLTEPVVNNTSQLNAQQPIPAQTAFRINTYQSQYQYNPQPQAPQFNSNVYASPQTTSPFDAPLSVGEYIVTFIVTGLPVIGFIMLLVWAFSGSTNKNKKNYCRAVLIIMLISIVLTILFFLLFGVYFAAMFAQFV